MTEAGRKHCTVAYATPERAWLWRVELPAQASIAQALEAARRLAGLEEVPWDSARVGVFGQLCGREAVPRDGDRIEIYRPLRHDPRQSRRARSASRR